MCTTRLYALESVLTDFIHDCTVVVIGEVCIVVVNKARNNIVTRNP